MDLIYKNLEEEDLYVVRDIYDYYVRNSTATFHTGNVTLQDLKEFIFINHPKYQSYLVIDNDTICGYAYLTRFRKREAYDRTAEITVYIKPEFSGRGIGKAALIFLEEQAKKVNIKVLIATISGTNKHSLHVFEKLGYTCCGHFREVGEKFGEILDVFSYQKILSQ